MWRDLPNRNDMVDQFLRCTKMTLKERVRSEFRYYFTEALIFFYEKGMCKMEGKELLFFVFFLSLVVVLSKASPSTISVLLTVFSIPEIK